jgi:hypothetical protein
MSLLSASPSKYVEPYNMKHKYQKIPCKHSTFLPIAHCLLMDSHLQMDMSI